MRRVMVTLVPCGLSLMSETVPTCTPAISTEARIFSPPTLAARSRMLYVGRKKVVPLLNWSKSADSSTRPMRTNNPTFHSRRDLFISQPRSEIEVFGVRNALDKAFHDGVLGCKHFIGRSSGVNLAVVQHQDALAQPARAAHVMSDHYRGHLQPIAHAEDEMIDVVRHNRVQAGRRLVVENDFRLINDRPRQANALFHAARQL